MSKEHDELFQRMMQGKSAFDPEIPKDYSSIRTGEEKEGDKLPEGVNVQWKNIQGIPVEELRISGAKEKPFVLYIHGGGFVTGSARSRHFFTGYLAKQWRLPVYAVEYRLAPEHPFPAAPEDCYSAFTGLSEQYGAENIILVGESAGGNLVLSLTANLRCQGRKMPAAVIAFAPPVQFDQKYPSYRENRETDCMITNVQEEMIACYLGKDANLRNPLAAPLYADVTGFPPVFLNASRQEVLRDDAIAMYQKLKDAGVDVELSLREGMMHTYTIFPDFPEARDEMNKVRRFLADRGILGAAE